MTAAPRADGRQDERVQNYTKFWQQDTKDETEVDNANRLNSYTEVVNGYYDGATDLYEWAWGPSFHFCRFYKGEGFYAGLARHEHYLSAKMGIKRGWKVLDVGCGVGGPAREIAQFSGAEIVGFNNNDCQIRRGRKYTKKMGIEDQVTFVKGDFMKLTEQFGEGYFDAVYAIEATVHAPSFEGIYGEIFKVLKPGGVFGVYEWCMTDDWDPSIPEHKAVAHGIEIGNGIPEMRPLRLARKALRDVGFEVEYEEDLADYDDEVKWYYPLEGDMSKAQTLRDFFVCWGTSWMGKFIMHNILWFFTLLGLLPKGTMEVANTLKTAQDALVSSGRDKLFTPMFLAVSRKPATH
ncbi:Delta(24)-sterol C-methyltransferase [Marasmius sp. AFHP31]|nr:Delta(24)-sterol C-methyltransferase [Marasmius sp. AFHP31]